MHLKMNSLYRIFMCIIIIIIFIFSTFVFLFYYVEFLRYWPMLFCHILIIGLVLFMLASFSLFYCSNTRICNMFTIFYNNLTTLVMRLVYVISNNNTYFLL